MMRLLAALLLSLAALVSDASAGQIPCTALSFEQTTSGCPRNDRSSASHPFTTLDCPSSGTPAVVCHFTWPSNIGTSIVVNVDFLLTETDIGDNSCWTIQAAAWPASSFPYSTTFPVHVSNGDAVTTIGSIANGTGRATSAPFAISNSATSAACVGTECQGKPGAIRLIRNNLCANSSSQVLGLISATIVY